MSLYQAKSFASFKQAINIHCMNTELTKENTQLNLGVCCTKKELYKLQDNLEKEKPHPRKE